MARTRKRILIWFLEGIALLLAVIAVAVGAGLWRLSQGPVRLDAAQPRIERAIGEALGGDAVDVEHVFVAWSPDANAAVVRLEDVTVTAEDGALIAEAPLIEADISLAAAARGKLSFKRLLTRGGVFSIVRDEDGRLKAGLGEADRVLAGPGLDAGAGGGAGGGGGGAATADLRVIEVREARFMALDARTGFAIDAQNAEIIARRNDDASVSATVTADVITPDGAAAPIRARLDRAPDARAATVSASFMDVRPAQFATPDGALAMLAGLDAPVSAQVRATLGSDGALQGAEADVRVGAGRVELAPMPLTALDRATLRARFDAGADRLTLDALTIASANASGSLSGAVDGLAAALPDLSAAQIGLDLTLRDARADLRPMFRDMLEPRRAAVKGVLDLGERAMTFETLELDILNVAAAMAGRVGLTTLDDGSSAPFFDLAGPIEGVATYDDVLAIWPVEFAMGARDFLVAGLSAGEVFDMDVDVAIPAEAVARKRLDDDHLTMTFGFRDAQMRFVSTMSPLRAASGSAVLKGNRFDLTLTGGTLRDAQVSTGYFEIPRLNPKGAVARFGGTATASARDVMAFLDEPPLLLPSSTGVDPAAFSGDGEVTFEVRRRMRRVVPASDIGFEVSGTFTDVTAPTSVPGLMISNASLEVEADPAGVTAVGEGMMGPAPSRFTWSQAFDPDVRPSTRFGVDARVDARVFDVFGIPTRTVLSGAADVSVSSLGEGMLIEEARVRADLTQAELTVPGAAWTKPMGEAAGASLVIRMDEEGAILVDDIRAEGPDLQLRANASLASNFRLVEARVSAFDAPGLREFEGWVRRGEGDLVLIDARAAYADVEAWLKRALGAGSGVGATAPVRASIQVGRARVDDAVALNDLALTLDHDGEHLRELTLDAGSDDGPVTAAVTPGATVRDRRVVTASAPNAGALMNAIFDFANIDGGALTLDGSLPPIDAQPADDPAQFNLVMEEFSLRGTPVLARILTLGSLRGLADTLGGEGIFFDRLSAPVSVVGDRYVMEDVRAAGSAIGFTVDGWVDLKRREVTVEGVLVPAYSVNSFLGGVPILGDVLVSRDGEGVFALTYSVTGPFSQTRVFVNPLSALAPGVLRRIFEPVEGFTAAPDAEDGDAG